MLVEKHLMMLLAAALTVTALSLPALARDDALATT